MHKANSLIYLPNNIGEAEQKIEINKLRLSTLGDLYMLRSLSLKSNPESSKFNRMLKLIISYLSTLP